MAFLLLCIDEAEVISCRQAHHPVLQPEPVRMSVPALLLMPLLLPEQPLLPLLEPVPAYSLEQQGRLYIPSH
jgi:hypothetical protein